MLEWSTVDVIYSWDHRRDTGGVGCMVLYDVLYQLINLANGFYTYLTCSNPLFLLLAYLILYLTCVFFITKVETTLRLINKDTVPK